MNDLQQFQSLYGIEPRKEYSNALEFRATDLDQARQTAQSIIDRHSLNLKVVTTASLVSMRCFQIEMI